MQQRVLQIFKTSKKADGLNLIQYPGREPVRCWNQSEKSLRSMIIWMILKTQIQPWYVYMFLFSKSNVWIQLSCLHIYDLGKSLHILPRMCWSKLSSMEADLNFKDGEYTWA